MSELDHAGWIVEENKFEPLTQHHKETIFTIGNGYLCTRGAFEEGYPGDHPATFIHGVFDAAPIVFTELANSVNWLPLTVHLNGEAFRMDRGSLESYHRQLNLHHGLLTRSVDWHSAGGVSVRMIFERFVSMAQQHCTCQRITLIPDFDGEIELRAGLNGHTDNEGLVHYTWVGQREEDGIVVLQHVTRQSKIEVASAMKCRVLAASEASWDYWDAANQPVCVYRLRAVAGKPILLEKICAIATNRDGDQPAQLAVDQVRSVPGWDAAFKEHAAAWEKEWERSDVVIEGDAEAQLAIRFNLYHLLIAAPRQDDRVNIGAKTLSGFGYRGHAFWDTEIFMLPFFTFTAPHIAKNLLNYRHARLEAAREKARSNGFEGAQFPWESADTGKEVTPSWVPDFDHPSQLVRIWTGDIEIHISADIAYAVYQYWRVSGDDEWMIARGAEIILDTAKFWATRGEYNQQTGRYEYNDVIGPDEYHEHVDNNAYTNRMAAWNLATALQLVDWLRVHAPDRAAQLIQQLDLTPARLEHWREVISKMTLHVGDAGLIEQFDGYYQREFIDLAGLEPRDRSVQVIYGIEGTNQTQVLKQPDVVMLLYLLRQEFTEAVARTNYDFYTPRTDHTYGSSLGPSIQAIMAAEMGYPEEAYLHFIRAARADLRDVRGNAGDGIHAASAGGTWLAVVFGFADLRIQGDRWSVHPRLPAQWKKVKFHFYLKGEKQTVEIVNAESSND